MPLQLARSNTSNTSLEAVALGLVFEEADLLDESMLIEDKSRMPKGMVVVFTGYRIPVCMYISFL